MPSSRKNKTKQLNEFDRFAESFQKLHPVHYQIFDMLKQEFPLALIRTCRALYDELIPQIYERITIGDADDLGSIIYNINVEWNPDEEFDEEGDGDDEQVNNEFPIFDSKNKALQFTKYIKFAKSDGATEFVSEAQYCESPCGCDCQETYNLVSPIFPVVTHISLGEDVVNRLVQATVAKEEICSCCWDFSHRLDEFIDCLAYHTSEQLETLCMEWPESWIHQNSNEYEDEEEAESDYDEDWAIKKGMSKLLNELCSNLPLKHVIIHLNKQQLINFDLMIFPGMADTKFDFVDSARWDKAKCIKTLWDHYRRASREEQVDNLPLKYCFPFSKSPEKYFTRIREKVKPSHLVRFEHFRQKLIWNDYTCECRDDDSEDDWV
ncbi:uncharacterized protein I206_101259 [Kwoniella pini CBS 10737]|uniref:Uncharacterized protein n=1 Tax=Kwoniella pini CBS 10737 TaxID=1296096 RepID=A0A1B9IBJ6_9TREE|nr:uncharacterized protein I206_00063 [Kwoniella pini CBS 10737]OCF52767.1 hypothetical protein I206_00063 [Kwoniella pini CBS 10737]